MDNRIYFFYMISGFLLGSILFAYEIPLLVRHIDIREVSEDGNPGTFNAFVFGGVGCGFLVLLAELLKGFLPVYLCCQRAGRQSLLFAGVLTAPVLGHAFSVFHRGKGGKGIAVSFGVLLGLFPWLTPALVLAGIYLFFSLIVPVKSHLKRSVVTFGCFGIVAFIGNWSLEIKLGIWLLSLVVIYKHVTAAELEIKKENWRTR